MTARNCTLYVRNVASIAVLVVALLAGVGGARAHGARSAYAGEAVAALDRLDVEFYDAPAGLYRVTGGQHEPYAALWPTSQVLSAAIAVAAQTGAAADLARVRRIIGSLHVYAATGGGYHARIVRSLRYYDDNNWIALDLLDAYGLLHDSSYLTTAEHVFAFITTGWDAQQGGIIWADGHQDRPTVSTAPAITIALRLAQLTHESSYLSWAHRLYDWENAHLRAPNGLYWDHILANGTVDKDFVSYNQGVMIDADLAFARATGQSSYATDARLIAAETAAAFAGPWRDRGQYAAYDAIYFQALSHLAAASPGSVTLAPVRDFVSWEWPVANASRPASQREEGGLLEQAAFVLAAETL